MSGSSNEKERVRKIYTHLFLKDTSGDPLSGPNALREERSKATFNVREMTYFLDGGQHVTAFNESIMNDLESLPHPENCCWYDQSHDQVRASTLSRVRQIYSLMLNDQSDDAASKRARAALYALYDMHWFIRQGVHFGLFMGAIMGQGDPDQQAKWLPPTMMLQIYGSFAMTELGHGSFLRGLETTATYDRETQEFVLNSPTDTSTKWWIGAAGETASHTVCYAQLIIDHEPKGVHNFIVQIRDTVTHKPLAGIHVGDCGSKMGLNGVDNGWIQFDHVRIPRENMLCKYAKVAADGTYVKPLKAQMAYGALINSRGDLVMLSCNMMKRALTIAIRYGAIRRQGEAVGAAADTAAETKLLEYQSHQQRLMPLLATAYAFHFQVRYVRNLLDQLDNRLLTDDDNDDQALLADVHATMAGLKAFSTWTTQAAIEECRQCCGGHGYSSYNGLGGLVADFAVMVTWEGDNTVMAQQTARYLIASFQRVKRGEKLIGSVTYLATTASEDKTWRAKTLDDVLEPAVQLEALGSLAFRCVERVALRLESQETRRSDARHAWNDCQVELIHAARIHVLYTVALHFVSQLEDVPETNGELRPVLGQLCSLFMLHVIQTELGECLLLGLVSSRQAEWIQEAVRKRCRVVRENAVPLVDAFNFSDTILNSCIGRKDGNVYQSLLETVAHRTGPTPYFQEILKPMMDGEMMDDVYTC